MPKAAFFDFDGVIVDSYHLSLSTLQALHHELGLFPLTDATFSKLFEGNPWEEYAKLGLSTEQKDALLASLKEVLIHRLDEMPFFPGMPELLRSVSAKVPTMIITSNHSQAIHERLDQVGLADDIAAILGADQPGNKQEKIMRILEERAWEAADTMFITDTTGDVRAVTPLGVPVIGVSWGYHNQEHLRQAGATHVAASPGELATLLQV